MGVKHTVRLTREQAERRYLDLRAKQKERKWKAKAVEMTATELEDELERLNDLQYDDGEGFENYFVSSMMNDEPDWNY